MLRCPTSLVVLFGIGACVDRSDADPNGEGIGDVGGIDDEDEVTQEGNFPQPAMSACGELPPGMEPISGLASAWVVEGTFMGTNELGEHGPMNGLRLRLSDDGMACDAPFPAASAECTDAWGWAMTLPEAMQAAGSYALSDWGGIYVESAFQATGAGNCAEAGGGGGDGGTDPVDIAGSIEILSFTDACVVGYVEDIAFSGGALEDVTGGFVAMRCATDCIPQFGENDCD